MFSGKCICICGRSFSWRSLTSESSDVPLCWSTHAASVISEVLWLGNIWLLMFDLHVQFCLSVLHFSSPICCLLFCIMGCNGTQFKGLVLMEEGEDGKVVKTWHSSKLFQLDMFSQQSFLLWRNESKTLLIRGKCQKQLESPRILVGSFCVTLRF